MYKKFQAFFLCAALGFSIAACSGGESQDLLGPNQDVEDTQESGQNSNGEQASDESPQNAEEGSDTPEPLLGEDATDEELLEVLSDDINVVTDEDYVDMVTAFKEKTEEHTGKIYQLEGLYTTEDGIPYVTRTIVDGDNKTVSGMPLKYVTGEPEEGSWIRITGIVNNGDVNGEDMAVLETVVLQVMEEKGQEELSAH